MKTRCEIQNGTLEISPLARFPEISPVCVDFPPWLGGMTQDEAGLTLTRLATA